MLVLIKISTALNTDWMIDISSAYKAAALQWGPVAVPLMRAGGGLKHSCHIPHCAFNSSRWWGMPESLGGSRRQRKGGRDRDRGIERKWKTWARGAPGHRKCTEDMSQDLQEKPLCYLITCTSHENESLPSDIGDIRFKGLAQELISVP